MKAILRRRSGAAVAPARLFRFGELEIDEAAREVRISGVDLRVKPREFDLVALLARNPGIALSRELLLQRVWGWISPATSAPSTSTSTASACACARRRITRTR
ncbi:MAG: response regulator transcription factor [Candidatus Eremiobacteraeota bacterium]|nr:response regulator transcription factor [Candidatus Eremiobacteraeota bacterium]